MKIKWKNVALLMILLVYGGVIIHDIFIITIYSIITSKIVGWTSLGMLTFILAITSGIAIINYFDEEINGKN